MKHEAEIWNSSDPDTLASFINDRTKKGCLVISVTPVQFGKMASYYASADQEGVKKAVIVFAKPE